MNPSSRQADAPPLRYSLAEFAEVIFRCMDAVAPRRVVEIGSEHGTFTRRLTADLPSSCEILYVVEPDPREDVAKDIERSARSRLVKGFSPEALAELPPCDAYFIDGDHNYATVSAELAAIEAASPDSFPVVMLHDVAWPWGRRDLYHDPDRLEPADRHPYSTELGPKPGSDALAPDGFGAESFCCALHEGGPRNGVRCAVEDFRSQRTGLVYREVPVIFGLGVLYRSDASYAAALDEQLQQLDSDPLLARAEEDRVALFARVAELEAAVGRDTAALAERDQQLADGASQVKHLSRELADASVQRDQTAQDLANERVRRQRVEAAVTDLDERLRALDGSRIMRWSRPLRRVWYRRLGSPR